MQYALLLYESLEDLASREGEGSSAYWDAWFAFSQSLVDAGVSRGGNCLQVPETSTTVRPSLSDGRVQDGPYADSKEQLGGLMIIDVPDLDTALDWAAKVPIGSGAVEVRPIFNPEVGACPVKDAESNAKV